MTETLMGTNEIADFLGVTRQRVHQLVVQGVLPRPEANLTAGYIWRREAIEEWASTHKDQISGPRKMVCNFCGKGEQEVAMLVAGPDSIDICNECTDIAAEIVLQGTAGTGLTRVPAYYFLHTPVKLPKSLVPAK